MDMKIIIAIVFCYCCNNLSFILPICEKKFGVERIKKNLRFEILLSKPGSCLISRVVSIRTTIRKARFQVLVRSPFKITENLFF